MYKESKKQETNFRELKEKSGHVCYGIACKNMLKDNVASLNWVPI